VTLTLLCSWLLSHTLLRGLPSAFTLELPPYRRPQVGQVLVRSVLDRTIFVLARAIAVAAPAGLLIWWMANIRVGELSILTRAAQGLDPIGRWFGLDGVILLAFALSFPANELFLPLVLMGYASTGVLTGIGSLSAFQGVLLQSGWTTTTALCTLFFCLLHWPCSTTCISIYKETHSLRWTAAAFLLPTCFGLALCRLVCFLGSLI
jgi:ferrous iron transport protein B